MPQHIIVADSSLRYTRAIIEDKVMTTETYLQYRAAMDAAAEHFDAVVEEANWLREEHFRIRTTSEESAEVKEAAAIARTTSGLRAGKQWAKWVEEMKVARALFLEG